jgi:KDO2-lipid IV(A) lauroyltransferase
MGKIGFSVVRGQRKIILANLNTAFPEKTAAEKTLLAKRFFSLFSLGSLEVLHFVNHRDLLDTQVAVKGRENLEEAMALGKGVIAITAHMGNFPLMFAKLAREGLPTYVIARPLRDEKSNDYIHQMREQAGIKTIFSYPRKDCVAQTIKALRENGIVFMLIDQNFGSGGVWVDFFGKLAATPTGTAVFALRTGAAILPMFIVREKTGFHTVYIEPKVPIKVLENNDETLLINTASFSKIIEQWIRRFPEQWGWIHRRWKSRPSQEILQRPYRVQQIEACPPPACR